jgi:hypothetical protein
VSGANIINHTFYIAQLQVLIGKGNVVHAHLSIKSHHYGYKKNKNKKMMTMMTAEATKTITKTMTMMTTPPTENSLFSLL